MGIGMAMFEDTNYEPTKGAPLNSNLADYIMAVNLDVPKLEVEFLEYPNTELNEIRHARCGRNWSGRHRFGYRQRYLSCHRHTCTRVTDQD